MLKIATPLFTWLLIANATALLGQPTTPNHEIYLSYGVYSIPRLAQELGTVIITVLTSPYTNITHTHLSGNQSIGLGYNYQLNSKYRIGGQFLYENFLEVNTFSDGQRTRSNTNTYTFLGRFYRQWVITDTNLQLYSSLSLGLSLYYYPHRAGPDTLFAFHLNPIGIQYGKSWAVFVETGVGWQGLLAAGITKRF